MSISRVAYRSPLVHTGVFPCFRSFRLPSLRTTARHIATYSASVLIGRLASIFLLPVYTRYLSPTDYGVMEMLEISSNLAILFLASALAESIYRFYAQAQDAEARDKVVQTAYAASLAMGLAIWFPCHFAAAPIATAILGSPGYAGAVRIAAYTIAISLPIEVGYAHIRAANESTRFAVLQLSRLLLQGSITVGALAGLHLGYL